VHDPMVVAFEIRRPWPQRWKLSPAWTSRRWWFPPMVTIWHVEPGGRDAHAVCKSGSRWRFHVWHWKVQIIPLQMLRRWLLTRCAGCGGRSTRANPVNVSLSWSDDAGPWWRGEQGLYHVRCAVGA
jgi:hypothetical protein